MRSVIVSTRSNHVRALLCSAWMVAVVNEDKLSAVLSEFARTLITDFPIQGILDHLVERIVEVLPDHVGRRHADLRRRSARATSPRRTRRRCASSSCRPRSARVRASSAYESGEAVAVPDLRDRCDVPAVRAGRGRRRARRRVHVPAPPRRRAARRADLYRDTPGDARSPGAMEAAQTLADVAAAYLLNAEAREEARVASERFHHSALHDPLTGLPNRLLLDRTARARRAAGPAVAHQRRGPVRRPRPVQAGQRHLRPPGRRRAAARRRAPPLGAGPLGRHAGPLLRRRVRVPLRGPAAARPTSRSSPGASTRRSPSPFVLDGIDRRSR